MKKYELNEDTSNFMLTDYTLLHNLNYLMKNFHTNLAVSRWFGQNFNDFGYLTLRAKTLVKLTFAAFKLHSFKAFANSNFINFLIGKTFHNSLIFYRFQNFKIAKHCNRLHSQKLIHCICKSLCITFVKISVKN